MKWVLIAVGAEGRNHILPPMTVSGTMLLDQLVYIRTRMGGRPGTVRFYTNRYLTPDKFTVIAVCLQCTINVTPLSTSPYHDPSPNRPRLPRSPSTPAEHLLPSTSTSTITEGAAAFWSQALDKPLMSRNSLTRQTTSSP
jgi:hypothetical protein